MIIIGSIKRRLEISLLTVYAATPEDLLELFDVHGFCKLRLSNANGSL